MNTTLSAKQQYKQAYSLTRSFHRAADGLPLAQATIIARAFIALRKAQGIPWHIDSAASDSYLVRNDTPQASTRLLLAKIDKLAARHA